MNFFQDSLTKVRELVIVIVRANTAVTAIVDMIAATDTFEVDNLERQIV